MKTTIELKTGSNTTVAFGLPNSYLPASKHKLVGALVSKAVGAPLEYIGSHLSSTIWSAGDARPITIRVIPTTEKLSAWYKSVGSPLGQVPVEFYGLNIDWRGLPKLMSWDSSKYALPPNDKTVHGRPNYPNMSPAQLKTHIENIPTDQTVSESMSAVDAVVESTIKTASGAVENIEAFFWKAFPIIVLGGTAALGLYARMKARRRY